MFCNFSLNDLSAYLHASTFIIKPMPFFIDYRLYPWPLLFTYHTGYDVCITIKWHPTSTGYRTQLILETRLLLEDLRQVKCWYIFLLTYCSEASTEWRAGSYPRTCRHTGSCRRDAWTCRSPRSWLLRCTCWQGRCHPWCHDGRSCCHAGNIHYTPTDVIHAHTRGRWAGPPPLWQTPLCTSKSSPQRVTKPL